MNKKNKTTRKKTKVIGTKQYVDQETGEIKEMQVINIEERDANFHKLWLGHIISSLELIGNQKMKVAMFILDNLNNDNMFIMTHREAAKLSGVSLSVVTKTLKSLQESDFLVKVQNGVYQVNPNMIFKGGKADRFNVLIQYENGKNEKK